MVKKYYLMGTHYGQVRTSMSSDSLEELREFGRTLKHYAIYRETLNGRKFHNATDPDFLVEHHKDPYWTNVLG